MSDFFTPLGPDAAPPAKPSGAADAGGARGGRIGKWFRRTADRVREEIRKRRKKKPPEPLPPPPPPTPPPPPPPPIGDVSLRVKVSFVTSTDTKEQERVDNERTIETTLWVSQQFVDVIRDHVRNGRQLQACSMLDEPIKTQYIGEEVHVTVTKIHHPEMRAGAQYMLTPNDVI